MAQNKIKKGFFFYFGMFVLLLATIFLICLVIMMFNPGKTVLWMQYFTSNGNYTPVVRFDQNFKTDDGDNDKNDEQEVSWSKVKSLKIEAGYANVTINKSLDHSLPFDGIYVVNKSKGFTTASTAVPFSVKIDFVGDVLTIKVTEPQGFLYFSKSVEIYVHATNAADAIDFSGLELNVETESGDINFGGSSTNSSEIKPSQITAKTTSGNIYFNNHCDMNSLSALDLRTSSGHITSSHTVGDTTGISANCDVVFETGKGELSLGALDIGNHTATINGKSGVVKINKVNADLVDFISCRQGNFIFGEVNSAIDFSNSKDTFISPNIIIDQMNGDFILSAGSKEADPDILINNFGDFKMMVHAKNGKLVAKNVAGSVDIVSNEGLSVDLTISNNNQNDIYIENDGGSEIKLAYLGNIAKTEIRANTGKVFINVSLNADFVAYMLQNKTDIDDPLQPPVELSKISVKIGNRNPANPLEIGETHVQGQEDIMIYTNGDVEFNPLAA